MPLLDPIEWYRVTIKDPKTGITQTVDTDHLPDPFAATDAEDGQSYVVRVDATDGPPKEPSVLLTATARGKWQSGERGWAYGIAAMVVGFGLLVTLTPDAAPIAKEDVLACLEPQGEVLSLDDLDDCMGRRR